MAPQTFKLPDLGEGLTESEVLNWKIQVGEHVSLNQIIAEVETAKAVVELPSPYAGIVQKLHASAGEVVPVGAALVTFGDEAGSDTAPVQPEAETSTRTPTLVGYGAPSSTGARPARRPRGTSVAHSGDRAAIEPAPKESGEKKRALATRSTPPVRKLARDHGIDIATVAGTGMGGLVRREDINALIENALPPSEHLPKQAQSDRHVKLTSMRRATAKAMVDSAFTAPHVTEFLTVDVTASMELLERLRGHGLLKGRKLNITTLTSLVISRLLQRYRALNSKWNEHEIIEFGAVNLGIAVASERGLLVPVIKNSGSKSLGQLAEELEDIIAHGRAGTLTPAQLTGGTFSLTNVGVFGVDAGTPILPPGQSGILALGQVKPRPWEYQGQVALRQTMTLALSFDHRVVDGKEASEFLAGIGMVLEDPGMMNIFI